MSKKPQNRAGTGPARDDRGRLKKGSTANPGGRPRTPADIKSAFDAATPRAVERLLELLESENEKVALKAAELVLERSLGKVSQPIAHSGSVTYNIIDPFGAPKP